MNSIEIIKEAFIYPSKNIKSLVIYVVLGIIAAFALGGTVAGFLIGAKTNSILTSGLIAIIGLIISILIFLLISGYVLDIVKYGIENSEEAPEIEFTRQILNGLKLAIVEIVYYIIPIIITAILSVFVKEWLAVLIGIILLIIFALVELMAECRLAKSDDLSYALAIGEAFEDLKNVGIVEILKIIVLLVVVGFVIFFIIAAIGQVNSTIGSILTGIFEVYYLFAQKRAYGLVYSN